MKLSKLSKISFAFAGIFCMTACALGILVPMLPRRESAAVFSEAAFADCSPTVVDGQTGIGIENAVIVVPETGEQYKTDANGKIDRIRIPYTEQASDIFPKDWCEITLLAYADGYAPYALFYLQLRENTAREGPVIMLFPGEQTFGIIEAPPEAWVSELLAQYAP